MSLMPVFSPYDTPVVFSETDTSEETGGVDAAITFTSQSIGAADAGRRVFVGVLVAALQGLTVTSATIGGQAATIHASNGADANEFFACIISAAVPTGTTADIILNLSETIADEIWSSIAVYRVLNLKSATAFDTASNDGADGSVSMSIDIPNGGFVIAGCSAIAGDGPLDIYTSTGVTESIESGPGVIGYAAALSAETNRSITFVPDFGTETTAAGVAASFR